MAFFSHLLLQTVSFARPTSTIDANGDRTYGSVTTVPAKVIGKTQEVLDAIGGQDKGNVKIVQHLILTEAEIRLGDRVWVEALGDTPGTVEQARYPVQVRASPGIRNTATLYTVFM
jgi:hypothetical protein